MNPMNPQFEKRLFSIGTPPPSPQNVSPVTTPGKEKFADRYIPVRTPTKWNIDFNKSAEVLQKEAANRRNPDENDGKDINMFRCLLGNELLGSRIERIQDENVDPPSVNGSSSASLISPTNVSRHRRLFEFRVSSGHTLREHSMNLGPLPPGGSSGGPPAAAPSCPSSSISANASSSSSAYSLSPLTDNSIKLLKSPKKPIRKISKIPYKVLDAPELQDDFYLNLVDWSSQNVLSVGLGACVYLWNASSGQVTKLCNLQPEDDVVTSVSWTEKGKLVSVGTNSGRVQIWDVTAERKIRELLGHSQRVGTLAWNGDILSSGSRDRSILQRDLRSGSNVPERKLNGHRQEVCGLKWSPDYQHLASGGNDNHLLVWNITSVKPLQDYADHTAAVKAISWSPHQHGLLASGGGTADRHIRFWNTLTGQSLQSLDTGSQVCNLAWSKHSNELVSTHGYSQNQILVWKYPSLEQVAKLTGHNLRVLYLAISPDGESIVTGAGDETLRFWNVFSQTRSTKHNKSLLNLSTRIR